MMYHVALRPALIAIGLFLLALFISVWMAFFTYRQNSETVFAEFDARADSLAAQISRELDITVATIEASASALSLGGSVDGSVLKEQLYTYLEKGNILASSPAIKNIGLVMNGGFKDASTPSPSFPLIGVYPDTSSKAIGADLSFSPERIAAIHFAQDTGRAGVGDRIVLLTGVPGVFFAFPIYATELIPVDSAARRKETVGLIVAVLATDSFMLNALSDIDLKGVDFEVHDLGSDTSASPVLGAQTVLASSRLEAIDYSDSSSDELLISSASDVITRDVEVGGHVWRILLAPKPNATNSLAVQVSWAIALVGLLISALVGFATYQQLIQSVSLKRRVQERTHALQTANSLISKRANEDDLTGLGNRRSLANAIDQMIEEHAAAELYSIAAIHIDLDRFKQINDTMGHAGGDFVLRHVAKLITSSFPDEAFCARVGGDEFTAALIIESGNEIALQDAAYGLIEACSLPVAFEGRPCRFGASVGIAVQSLPEADPKALLVDADLALYRAKEDGRGRVQLFSPEIHAQVIAYKHRSDDILRAIEAGNEFIPYLQPQISFSDGQLYGVEALARWKHPELGVLPPSEFLSIAEDLDVVAQIDRSILEGSIDIVNRCQELGYSVPHLSTNLSFSRLMEEEFVASVSNLPACDSSISFEILESIFLDEETGPAMWNIDKIRSAGFDVQIDDFGSGRASVVALTRVAPSRMKIDRELVAPIADHDERLQLVKSIVEIGKVLGIGVTAEGVETQKQAQLLGEMGCDVLQGYLFAKPLSEGDLLQFLRSFPISGKLAS
ncbi:EAL domain-containing protein [Shimia sp. R9_3]|uniref:putative bifunctional diguanylate cyclase/phosphodiesterase n=1 Tax=Shimia sp. R9_3 TaxID=2821113 RepID=UPI001AD9FC85|nr:EAL domain-containing protein [Shimia sp. R9_3]MBO9402895.1 EAL domain-containing protein [Shimia sp. R9_3]